MKALSVIVVCLALLASAAGAAEVSGVRLDDKTQVEGRDVVLNGAGLRKRFVFKVYVMGLYLVQKTTDAVNVAGPKRVSIHMLRDVGADQFTEALVEGLRANHSEEDFRKL